MHDFKVGDRVRFIDKEYNSYILGKTAVVTKLDGRSDTIHVKWDDHDEISSSSAWMAYRFEKNVDDAIDWNKPLQTKGGCPVRIFARDFKHNRFTVVGAYVKDGIENITYWTSEGKTLALEYMNLMNVPEPKKKYWTIFYRYHRYRNEKWLGYGTVFNSKEEAQDHTKHWTESNEVRFIEIEL